MKLYFVRHAESKMNIQGINHQDETNALTSEGIRQAKIVANRFRDMPVDLILSSDSTRAQQTAEEISKVLHKKVFYSDTLRELRRPSIIIGKKDQEPKVQEVIEALNKNSRLKDWHYSDEENFYDFKKRVYAFFDYLQLFKEENILVVTHGITTRMMVALMCFVDIDPETFLKLLYFLEFHNTGITVCDKNEKNEWKLITWNDHAHLG